MDMQMKRFEKRYIDVGDYRVKFSWVSKSSRLIKVTVLEEVKGLFGNRFKKVYSDNFMTSQILNYNLTAKNVVKSYLYENLKWESLEAK